MCASSALLTQRVQKRRQVAATRKYKLCSWPTHFLSRQEHALDLLVVYHMKQTHVACLFFVELQQTERVGARVEHSKITPHGNIISANDVVLTVNPKQGHVGGFPRLPLKRLSNTKVKSENGVGARGSSVICEDT